MSLLTDLQRWFMTSQLVIINALGHVKDIIDVVVRYHGLPDLIVSNWNSVFISKFYLLLCYFLDIRQRLSTAFHPQTNGQIKMQNITIEIYFRVFVKSKQNDWAKLLLIVKFAHNHAQDTNIGHIFIELNCDFYFRACPGASEITL